MPGRIAPVPGTEPYGAPPPQVQRYYSAKDLADLGRQVGWRDDRPSNDPGQRHSQLAVAVAIALAESGGDSQAMNAASGATGLWQIHPGGDQYLNAQTNAETAFAKYRGAGDRFTPWTTFTTKTYLVKLPQAEAAVKATYSPGLRAPGGGVLHDVLNFTGNIGHDLAAIFGWITSGETWIRLGEVLGGAILLLFALWVTLGKTDTGKKIEGAAKGAATKGML